MENESENKEITALKAQVEALKDSIKHSHDVLKWGLGVFGTIAIVFSGFNWWSGKTNYDRDKDALKQQSGLLEQSLALDQEKLAQLNEKQMTDLRRQNDTNLSVLAAAGDRRLEEIRKEAETSITNLLGSRQKEIDNAVANLNLTATNLTHEVRITLNDNIAQFNDIIRTNDLAASTLLSDLQIHLWRADALSLTVQGNVSCDKNRAKTPEEIRQMGFGVACLAKATKLWLLVHEEANVRLALNNLVKYQPMLLRRTKPGTLYMMDDLSNIAREIDDLTVKLENPSLNGRYFTEASELKARNTLFKKVVKEDRDRKLLK